MYVDIKYRDFSTLEGTLITPTFRVGVMKVPSVSLILPYFMVKIRFCHFLSLFVTFSIIIWIALVGLFVHVDIKYWDFLTLEGTFITPTFCVRVMKVSSVSLISPYFMVLFRFCHFLSLFLTFSIFSNVHDPRYMKPCKNQRFQFSLIFMTPGTWNLAKIRCFNFL